MTHRYTAAADGWISFIAPSRQLFVGADLDDSQIDRLWTLVDTETGPAAVLEVLAANGLFATPPFVFIEHADDVNVLVRGAAEVRAGAEVVSGEGATTWIERRLPAGTVSVALPGTQGASFPVRSGVVRASAFTVGSFAGEMPAPLAPATAAAPAPAPAVNEQTMIVVADEEADVAPEPEEEIGSPAAAEPAAEAAAQPSSDYDYLFGATMYRSVQDAAVQPEPEDLEETVAPQEEPAVDGGLDGDHDGATVMMTGRRGRRGGSTAAAPPPPPPPPAPPAPVIVLPDGTREHLEQALIVGRSPSVSGVPAAQLPRLITVTSSEQDISRSHVRIALEGGTVVVTDLHSRNGTVVTSPSGESQKLRGGEPVPVIVGSVIDLGGVALRVEEGE